MVTEDGIAGRRMHSCRRGDVVRLSCYAGVQLELVKCNATARPREERNRLTGEVPKSR